MSGICQLVASKWWSPIVLVSYGMSHDRACQLGMVGFLNQQLPMILLNNQQCHSMPISLLNTALWVVPYFFASVNRACPILFRVNQTTLGGVMAV